MPVVLNDKIALKVMEFQVGRVLIACAVAVQGELKQQLSKTGPPSKPGEFPRWVTGNLRESIVYEPTSPQDAGREQKVRVGYSKAGFYGAILELAKGRLGFKEVATRLNGRIMQLLGKLPKP